MMKRTRAGGRRGRQSGGEAMERLAIGLSGGPFSLPETRKVYVVHEGKVLIDLHIKGRRGLTWETVLSTVGSKGTASRV